MQYLESLTDNFLPVTTHAVAKGDVNWVLYSTFSVPHSAGFEEWGSRCFKYQNGLCTFALGFAVGASSNFGTWTRRATNRYLQ